MTKTLHICLSAGVGNRLFQYASIKAISKKYGYTFNIVDNIYDYQHNKKYNWFIDKINTDFKESKKDLTNVFTYDQPYTEHVGVVTTFDFTKVDEENIIINGFFQHEDNFIDMRDELLNILNMSQSIKDKIDTFEKNLIIPLKNVYAIHFRLGDYVNNQKHFVNLQTYYINCINFLRNKSNSKLNFLIICESPVEHIQYIYPGLLDFIAQNDNVMLVTSESDEEFDLYILTQCKGVICANSTFSWWGAWLNNNSNKEIFIPDKWLNDRNNIITMKYAHIISTSSLI